MTVTPAGPGPTGAADSEFWIPLISTRKDETAVWY